MIRVGLVGRVVGSVRGEKRLTARQVQTLPAGYHADGGGLYLQVSESGARSWIFRYQRDGRRREMGLGSESALGLSDARQSASEQRKLLALGKDPIASRRAAGAAGMTFGQAADAYIASHREGWKKPAQAAQWTSSLAAYGPKRDLPVADVTTEVVVKCLAAIWSDKTETASRVRGRIERILDWAAVSGARKGENPARWRGHLDKLLAKPSKVARVRHFAAMPFADVPAFYRKLCERGSLSRRALRFTILTAARTEEVTGALWREFAGDVWTRPAERMKAGKEHAIPLSAEALAIVRTREGEKTPFPLSNAAMLALLQREMGQPYTVHGFRSSFRDWAAETTDFPAEVVEMALAHTIKSDTEKAYRRGALLAKRRELMAAWAAYVTG
jgi:integrase